MVDRSLPAVERVIDTTGGAFGMGCIGGFLWHGVQSFRNFPKGQRLAGSLATASTKAPTLGGHFAQWAAVYSSVECVITQRHGTPNSRTAMDGIASGFFTAGILSARFGTKIAGRTAVVGGLVLAVVEAVAYSFRRTPHQPPPVAAAPRGH